MIRWRLPDDLRVCGKMRGKVFGRVGEISEGRKGHRQNCREKGEGFHGSPADIGTSIGGRLPQYALSS